MIKFFRKIRESLLAQNKLGKYLVYAIGEIVLVVIGILLALNINNRNQERINEEKFIKIFKEIQDDLLADAHRANRIFDQFIIDDSIQDLILNNKYTREEYMAGNAVRLGNFYQDFVIQTNGYDNLLLNIENVPEKFQPLLKELKFLYGQLQTNIEVYNTRIRETVYKSIDYTYELEWYQSSIKGVPTEESTNYFLNDPHYKGVVIKYFNDRDNVFGLSQFYINRAKRIYNELSKHVDNDSLPEIMRTDHYDAKTFSSYVGEYNLVDKVGVFARDKITVTVRDNKLYFIDSDDEYELQNYKDDIFYIGRSVYCIFNKLQEGDLYLSGNISGYGLYAKVNN